MPRSKLSQSKHNVEVKRVATQFEEKGYDVKADIGGYSKPGTFGGYRPDVVAKKGREREIVEVETPDSVDSARDVSQQKAFKQVAKRSKNTTFRRTVTD